MEGRGETFLPACWEFLTFNLLFVLVSFFILRCGFNLLFNYRISILFRAYSSFVFLAPLLLDGNLQYFCFLLFSQVTMTFSFNFRDKMINVLNLLVYFLVIWFSVVSCFLAYYFNKKLAKYILGNWRTRINGLLTYSLTNAGRMLVFGAVHSLLRSHPAQLPLLMGLEILYVAFLICSMSLWRTHRVAYKAWFTVVFALVRVSLQLTLIIQQKAGVVGTGSASEALLEETIGFLLILYMAIFYVGTGW